jgi:hypothetical protein
MPDAPKDATPATAAANRDAAARYDLASPQLTVSGPKAALLDDFDPNFPVRTP